MKRLLIILLLLLLLVSPLNAQMLQGCMSAGGAAAGPVYTDCSNIGTASFYWNGEHTSGSTYGCKDASTTVNGTATGAEIVASGTDPGTASPSSAGNVVKVNAVDERLTFTITSGDLINSSEGRYCADIYAAASTGDNTVFRFVKDASNVLLLKLNSDGTIQILHTGNGVQAAITSTDTVSDTTWTNVCARWSVSNNKVSVKVGTGAWKDDDDADAVTAFTSEATTVRAMGGGTQTNDFYVDNVFIWSTSGL